MYTSSLAENWKNSPDPIKMPLKFANTYIVHVIIYNLKHHMSS
jgi:hypothetical protein